MCEANMPIYFMAEAINTLCYTQNRILINKLYGSTPYFLLIERKPTVKYFHVFGSKCFMMKDTTKITGKFDSKAHEGIFMGYSTERTSYRVFVIEHNTIEESVNVTFDETEFPGIIDNQAN